MLTTNIRALRKAKKWSQAVLAAKVGTTPEYVGKLERAEKSLHGDWIEKFAAAFGIQPHELFMPEAPTEAKPTVLEGRLISLPVSLPNVEVLTDMFEGLLELAEAQKSLAAPARTLAEYLPDALQLASGHLKSRPAFLKQLEKAVHPESHDKPVEPEQ